ncbi:MAG: flagellar hook-length control protein FliK [Verrucomicrobiia bacterium]
MGSFLMTGPSPAKPAQPVPASIAAGSAESSQASVSIICPAQTTAEVTVAESSETAVPVVVCDQAPQTGAFFFTRPLTGPLTMDTAGGESADTDKPQDVKGLEKGVDHVEAVQEVLHEELAPQTIAVPHQRGLREVAECDELADAENLADSCLQSDTDDDCADVDGAGSETGSLMCQSIAVAAENPQPHPAVANPAVVSERTCSSEISARPSASASATSADVAVTPAASRWGQGVESSQSIPWSSAAGNGQEEMMDVSTHVSPSSAPLLTLPTSGSATDSTEVSRLVGVHESDLSNVMPESAQPELDAKSDPVQMPSPQSVSDDGPVDYDTVAQRTTPRPEINPNQMPTLADSRRAWTASQQPIRIDQTPHGESAGLDSSNVDALPAVPVEAAFSFGASVVTAKTPPDLPSLVIDRPATFPEDQNPGVSQYQAAGLKKLMVAEASAVFTQEVAISDSQSEPIQKPLGSQQQPAVSSEQRVESPRINADSRFRWDLLAAGNSLASVYQDLPVTTGGQSPVAQGAVIVDVPVLHKDMAGEDALRGMDAAPIGDAMKKPNDLHTIAGSDENILPVESESGFVGHNRREPFGIRIGEKLDPSVLSGLFVTHEPEAGRQQLSFATASASPDTASTAASAQFSVESLADQLMDRVVKFKSLYQDNVAVMVMPDDNTEIHLQFTLGGDGVNVCARVERGDLDLLRANWDQLRQTLADHGVHMGELNRPPSDTNNLPQSATETNGGGAHEQAPRHQPRLNEELAEEIAGAGAMTETPHVRLHNARRVTPRRWEKWA